MVLRFFILSFSLVLGSYCLPAQEFDVYNFNQLEPRLHLNNDTTYVVNFWAMWCKPCIEELPYFEKAHRNYQDKKVKILLVSLDFGKKREQQLKNFLLKRKITAEVVILDDPDSNSWIEKVDSRWDGALPGTLIFKGEKRLFLAKQLSYLELVDAIQLNMK